MKSNIFIPKTIRVGYQKRSDTYTGNLAYVIYIDAQNKVRKEASWKSWRDSKIDPNDFTNEPTSGFVLNKKAGGYSTGWNHRQTYTRVYDPRGFEFEISIPNLLYILENTSAIKGKGLEGEFVYGWDGTELLLMPTSAPDYAQLTEFAEATFNKETITSKTIILGATYRTAQNEDWIYLGRFEEWEKGWREELPKNKGKKYWFKTASGSIETITSLSKKLIKTIDDKPVSDYADIMEDVERMERYAPYNPDADIVKRVSNETLHKISETVETEYAWGRRYVNPEVVYTVDGVEVVSTLTAIRERDAENKDKPVAKSFYLSTPERRIPLKPEEFEYKDYNGYGYSYGYEQGWEYDYSSNRRRGGYERYKRDKVLHEIREKVKKYTQHGYHSKDTFTLEQLADAVGGFSLRQKFLTNGKPLKMAYDDAIEFDYEYLDDDSYDENDESETKNTENIEQIFSEAMNG